MTPCSTTDESSQTDSNDATNDTISSESQRIKCDSGSSGSISGSTSSLKLDESLSNIVPTKSAQEELQLSDASSNHQEEFELPINEVLAAHDLDVSTSNNNPTGSQLSGIEFDNEFHQEDDEPLTSSSPSSLG